MRIVALHSSGMNIEMVGANKNVLEQIAGLRELGRRARRLAHEQRIRRYTRDVAESLSRLPRKRVSANTEALPPRPPGASKGKS